MGSLRRTATVTSALAVAAVGSLLAGSAAQGATGAGKSFDYTPKSGKPFDTITVTGGGCADKQVVTIRLVHDASGTLDGQLDLGTTSTGTFSGSFGIKAGARNGAHTITARCGNEGSATLDFVGDGPLPVSGGSDGTTTTSTTVAATTTSTVATTTTTIATVDSTTTTTIDITTTSVGNLNGTPTFVSTTTTAVATTIGGPTPTLGSTTIPSSDDPQVALRKSDDDGGVSPLVAVAGILGALVLVAGAALGIRSIRRS